MKAVVGATVLDGRGGPPIREGVVLVGDGVINAVGPAVEVRIPRGAEVIDAAGMFVLPGLIDCHVHLSGTRTPDPRLDVFTPLGLRVARATADLRRLLEAGVTTVRECGGETAIALKEAVAEGSIPGPRILAAGRFVEPTGGADDRSYVPLSWTETASYYGPRLANGPDECRRGVREQLREGADFIKTCSTGAAMVQPHSRTDILEWSDAEIRALIDEAHRKGVRVAVHAHAAEGIVQAVAAGADSIEHGTRLDEQAAALMRERGTFLVPTFFALHQLAHFGAEHGAPDFVLRKARDLERTHSETFRAALAYDLPIAMGTDCTGTPVGPHGQNAKELGFMVQAGMKPMQAIVAATTSAARCLGIDPRVGALEAGKAADLVVTAGDPLDDVDALQQVSMVMQGGKVVTDRR